MVQDIIRGDLFRQPVCCDLIWRIEPGALRVAIDSRQHLLSSVAKEPLHLALAKLIQNRLDEGRWAVGAQLPSVRELAREFGVSGATATRAVRVLTDSGVLQAIQGKGVFVTERVIAVDRKGGNPYLWQRAVVPAPSTTRLAALVPSIDASPDAISLASGGVVSDIFPAVGAPIDWSQVPEVGQTGVFRGGTESYRLLASGSPAGEMPVRDWLARYLKNVGIDTVAAQVIVTCGGQQAINVVAHTLLRPGDAVLVERPTYVSALAIFESIGAHCLEVPVDAKGLVVDVAARLMAAHRPRLLLTVPTGHNPTGVTMPTDRRSALLEAARRHDVMILEEDRSPEYSYDQQAPPAIKSLDHDGHVIYVRSFGMMTGCIVSDGPVFSALVEAKRLADRYTPTFTQNAFLAFVTSDLFHHHLEQARNIYRDRRDAMLAALEREMPSDVAWLVPSAGFNVWLTLPHGVSGRAVVWEAAREGVLVLPGGPFFYQRDPDNSLRLTYSDNQPPVLTRAISRLGCAIRNVMRRTPSDEGARFGPVMA